MLFASTPIEPSLELVTAFGCISNELLLSAPLNVIRPKLSI